MTLDYTLAVEAVATAIVVTKEEPFRTDERSFRAFYAQTASRLRAYLARASGPWAIPAMTWIRPGRSNAA